MGRGSSGAGGGGGKSGGAKADSNKLSQDLKKALGKDDPSVTIVANILQQAGPGSKIVGKYSDGLTHEYTKKNSSGLWTHTLSGGHVSKPISANIPSDSAAEDLVIRVETGGSTGFSYSISLK